MGGLEKREVLESAGGLWGKENQGVSKMCPLKGKPGSKREALSGKGSLGVSKRSLRKENLGLSGRSLRKGKSGSKQEVSEERKVL